MNVDRPPASTDNPRPDARDDASRSTDSPAPENPPTADPETHLRAERAPDQEQRPEQERKPGQEQRPDQEQGPEQERKPDQERKPGQELKPDQERKPDQEQRPEKAHDPAREHPPPSSPTETDSDCPANNTPDPAEPRSRQEHATPPSEDEREISAKDEAGDWDPTDAAEADATPEGEVALDDVGTQEEAKQDLGSAGEPRPEDLQRGDEIVDNTEVSEAFERTDTGSPDQEGQLNGQANQATSAAQGEKTAGPTDALSPVRDKTLPLTDKEWSEHVMEVRDTLDKARAAGLESHLTYTIDPDHQAWSKDRRAVHEAIIDDLYSVLETFQTKATPL